MSLFCLNFIVNGFEIFFYITGKHFNRCNIIIFIISKYSDLYPPLFVLWPRRCIKRVKYRRQWDPAHGVVTPAHPLVASLTILVLLSSSLDSIVSLSFFSCFPVPFPSHSLLKSFHHSTLKLSSKQRHRWELYHVYWHIIMLTVMFIIKWEVWWEKHARNV